MKDPLWQIFDGNRCTYCIRRGWVTFCWAAICSNCSRAKWEFRPAGRPPCENKSRLWTWETSTLAGRPASCDLSEEQSSLTVSLTCLMSKANCDSPKKAGRITCQKSRPSSVTMIIAYGNGPSPPRWWGEMLRKKSREAKGGNQEARQSAVSASAT